MSLNIYHDLKHISPGVLFDILTDILLSEVKAPKRVSGFWLARALKRCRIAAKIAGID